MDLRTITDGRYSVTRRDYIEWFLNAAGSSVEEFRASAPISAVDFGHWLAASYTDDMFLNTSRNGAEGQKVYITASMITGNFIAAVTGGLGLTEEERDVVRAPLDQARNSFPIGRQVLSLIKQKTRDPDLGGGLGSQSGLERR
ncbi:MAG: hypothetical protein EB060_04315 [Proteobacteria bacterium]|nr:hypothetical protein [Pseudomonadota bacterium]